MIVKLAGLFASPFSTLFVTATSLSIGYCFGCRVHSLSRPIATATSPKPLRGVDPCKLVLVVRSDLNMSTGKIAAQCSHATLACYKTLLKSDSQLLRQWERNGQTKIVLRCADEEELLMLQARARSLELCAQSIQDAGRTQVAAGSTTVLGILGAARLVNQVTGSLALL